MVEEFLPLIERVARECSNAGQLTRGELVQEGVVGLLRALDRYDPMLAGPFWGYAFWWVLQAMRQLIGELAHPVALTSHALDDLTRIEQAYGRLQCAGHEVTLGALSAETGLAAAALARLIAAGWPPQALEQQVRDPDGERTAFGEQIADPHAEDDYEQIVVSVTASQLRVPLEGLNYREQVILKARYGLDGEPETLRQISLRLGITRERVRQIQTAALRRLQADAIGVSPRHASGARAPHP